MDRSYPTGFNSQIWQLCSFVLMLITSAFRYGGPGGKKKKKAFLRLFLAFSCRRMMWGSLPVLMFLKTTIVCPEDNIIHEQKILKKLISSVYSWQSNASDGVPQWKLN